MEDIADRFSGKSLFPGRRHITLDGMAEVSEKETWYPRLGWDISLYTSGICMG